MMRQQTQRVLFKTSTRATIPLISLLVLCSHQHAGGYIDRTKCYL